MTLIRRPGDGCMELNKKEKFIAETNLSKTEDYAKTNLH